MAHHGLLMALPPPFAFWARWPGPARAGSHQVSPVAARSLSSVPCPLRPIPLSLALRSGGRERRRLALGGGEGVQRRCLWTGDGDLPPRRSRPLRRRYLSGIASTPEVGGGSSGRSSPPPAAFALVSGARLPRSTSRRGRLHFTLRTGCLSRTPLPPSVWSLPGGIPRLRRLPPQSQTASGSGRLRLGGQHVFLGLLASLLAKCGCGPLPLASTGSSPTYAGGVT